MQTIAHDQIAGVYATGPDYVHAVEVRAPARLVFVSGTMGLDPAGVPGRALAEQLTLVWRNIGAILARADMTLADVVRVTSYLRDAADADENARARVAALGGRRVPTTAIVVETLDPAWRVEIEVIAAA